MNAGVDEREAATIAGERATLVAFLDRQRSCVVSKVAGLDEEAARTVGVESGTTVMGLVKHLRWVEHGWFELLVRQGRGSNARPHDRTWEFTPRPEERLVALVDDYRLECRQSNETIAAHDLDATIEHDVHGQLTVRWILLHLVEETARHLGHIDILVEQVEGATGLT